jgi:hypothetical protein
VAVFPLDDNPCLDSTLVGLQKNCLNLPKMIEKIPVLKGVQDRDFGTKKIIGTPGYPFPVLSGKSGLAI